MMLHEVLFPSLVDLRWGYLNFGEEARTYELDEGDINPLLDPNYQSAWVTGLTKARGYDLCYGGWMEDRNHLWRNHYMKPDCAWHLGIDYSAPVGTPVRLPVDGVLSHSRIDPDQDGGWGGQVIFKIKGRSIIFGHLERIAERHGEWKAGEIVGYVADRSKNGNWSPHLHLQLVRDEVVAGRGLDLLEIDGYSELYTGIEKDFPRPDDLVVDIP